MTTEDAMRYYNDLPDNERMELNIQFGNEDIADREIKFYEWLSKQITTKNKD